MHSITTIAAPITGALVTFSCSYPHINAMQQHPQFIKTMIWSIPKEDLTLNHPSTWHPTRVARFKNLTLYINICHSPLLQIGFQARLDLRNLMMSMNNHWIMLISLSKLWETTISTVSVNSHGNQISSILLKGIFLANIREIGEFYFFDRPVCFFLFIVLPC